MPQATQAKKRRPAAENLPAVLTLSEVAKFLRLPAKEVERLAKEQGLPGRKIGTQWRFLRAAIESWLATGNSQKRSVLNQIGAFADEPNFEEFQEELRRLRKELNEVA